MSKQRFLVAATYVEGVVTTPYPNQHPRIMGYYDVDTPDEAFEAFLDQHAFNLEEAQWFYDDIMVIPVPKDGYSYKLSSVFGELAKFPNFKYIEG